jgi:hypothetical protein
VPAADAELVRQQIDAGELTAAVRMALDDPTAEVVTRADRVVGQGIGHATAGLYHLGGTARAHSGERSWSLFAKALRSDGADAPHDPNYWRREALVYGSGMLDELRGELVAPRCYGVAEHGDGTVWLWLEDIVDAVRKPWPLERLALAARHLGAFHGRQLGAAPRPDRAWLAPGWLRGWVEGQAASVARLAAMRGHPLVERGWPGPALDGVLQLWEEREAFFAALDRLPRTLLHGDASVNNLLARRSPDGADVTVAIDWAYASIGAVGEDVAPLLRPRPNEPVALAENDRAVLGGYTAGLRQAGWSGDDDEPRFGAVAAGALRYAFHHTALQVLDERNHAELERLAKRPVTALLDFCADLHRHAVHQAAEARTLAPSLRG